MNQTLRCLSLLLTPGKNRARSVYEMLAANNAMGERSLYLNLGFWSRGAQDYDQACEELARVLGEAARLGPADRVLDVGFGFADQDMLWSRQFGCEKIVGLNITPSQVAAARERVEAAGLSGRVDLREGSATAMPVGDGQFTKVTALETAFHYDTREDFFREAYRALKPGGRLAAADIIPLEPAASSLKARLGDYLGRSFWQIPAANQYPRAVYARKLAEAGFRDIELRSIAADVYAPFCRHARQRLVEAPVARRMNPLVRRFWLESVRDESSFAHLDYVIATAVKP